MRWRTTTTRSSGLAPDASADDIKTAFRTLAREHHPDATGGDPAVRAALQGDLRGVRGAVRSGQARSSTTCALGSERRPVAVGLAVREHDRGHLRDVLRRRRRRPDAHAPADARAAGRVDGDHGRASTLERGRLRGEADARVRALRAVRDVRRPGGRARDTARAVLDVPRDGPGPAGATHGPRQSSSRRTRASRAAATGWVVPNPCKDCRGDGRASATSRTSRSISRPGIDEGDRMRARRRRLSRASPAAAAGDLYVRFDIDTGRTVRAAR